MKLPVNFGEDAVSNPTGDAHGSLPGLTMFLTVLTGLLSTKHKNYGHITSQEDPAILENVSYSEYHLTSVPSGFVTEDGRRSKREAADFEPYDAMYSNSTKGFLLRLRGDNPRFLYIANGSMVIGSDDGSHSSCLKRHIFHVVVMNLAGEISVLQDFDGEEYLTGQSDGQIGLQVDGNYDLSSIRETDDKFFRIFNVNEGFYSVQNLHNGYYLSATDDGVTSVSQEDFDSSSHTVQFEMYGCDTPIST